MSLEILIFGVFYENLFISAFVSLFEFFGFIGRYKGIFFHDIYPYLRFL